MHISLFTIVMTVLWSSALIVVLYILRKKLLVLEVCSVGGIVFVYLFCAFRLVLPIELPWTKVIDGGLLWDNLERFVSFELLYIGNTAFSVGHVLLAIWMTVACYKSVKIAKDYFKISHYISSILKEKMVSDLPDIPGIDIYKSKFITTPCAVGIRKRMILFPDREYTKEQETFILMHEIAHHRNKDILIKLFTNILCALYWWNPIVYLLKKDINHSLELRCDQHVTQFLDKGKRAEYLSVILEELKHSVDSPKKSREYAMEVLGQEDSLVERFTMVANGKYSVPAWKRITLAGMMLIYFLGSYSFVIQSSFDAPIGEIDEETYYFDATDSFILHHKDGTYSLVTTIGTIDIDDEEVAFYCNNGFKLVEE